MTAITNFATRIAHSLRSFRGNAQLDRDIRRAVEAGSRNVYAHFAAGHTYEQWTEIDPSGDEVVRFSCSCGQPVED